MQGRKDPKESYSSEKNNKLGVSLGAGSRSALPGQGAVHGDSRGRLGSGTGKKKILIHGGLHRLSRAGINHGRIGPVRSKSA